MADRRNSHVARFLLASSLALGLGSSAIAEPTGRQGSQAHGRMAPGGAFHPGPWLRGLELSDAQQDQVFKIFHEQAPAMHERMKAARLAREELNKLASGSEFDRSRARQAADAEAKSLADIALMRAESMHRVRSILTAEQREKLDSRRW